MTKYMFPKHADMQIFKDLDNGDFFELNYVLHVKRDCKIINGSTRCNAIRFLDGRIDFVVIEQNESIQYISQIKFDVVRGQK